MAGCLTRAERVAACINSAGTEKNPFSPNPARAVYKKGQNFEAKIAYHTASSLPEGMGQWAAQLVGSNLGKMYEETWGWDIEDKLKDLNHPEARHLLAFTRGNSNPVAYCHYRWEQDPLPEETDDTSEIFPILYIYEVQLKEHVRGKGLGSYMMQLLEEWAIRHGMAKVMLTCFQANEPALTMYKKLGYELDDSSPDPEIDGPECAGYDILCKWLPGRDDWQ